jgi:pimeloyl-ACP methyl ester carboxylesterase
MSTRHEAEAAMIAATQEEEGMSAQSSKKGKGGFVWGEKKARKTRWAKKGPAGLFVTLLALAAAGLVFQAVATRSDQSSESHYQGRMVSVGDHRLHIDCMGAGSPTVVLESGWSFTSIEWSAHVQPEVAKHTRVCAYDRAGLAYSEAGPAPRDANEVADELHTLLHKANVKGPYVLVGHSLGGLYTRVYADRYPKEVAGMVLVQSMHPDQFQRLGTESALRTNRLTGIVGPPLARLGVVRLLSMLPPNPNLPASLRKQAGSLYYQMPHLVAELEEVGAMPEALDQARETGSPGDKPLAVVSASDYGVEALTDSKAAAARYDRESHALQKDLTHLSPDSTQRVVQGSTDDTLVLDRHYAEQTNQEITRVVEAVRQDRPLSR